MSDNVELVANSWKIHASEKRSTGDYETFSTNVSLEGDIPRGAALTEETRTELKARLFSFQKELQEVVVRTGENRLKADGHADWSVRNGESE